MVPLVVPDVAPEVVPLVVPDVVPEVVPDVGSRGRAGRRPLVVPPEVLPSVTLMVADAFTVSFAAHLVSVSSGLLTLMLYAPGVSVTSPAFVSFSLAFMSDSFIGLSLGIAGFSRGPSTASSPVCAPPTVSVPVG